VNDQQLLLFALKDGLSAAEQASIAAALKLDPALRARLTKLEQALGDLRQFADMPVSEAALNRWQSALDRAQRLQEPASRGSFWRWQRAIGVAAFASVLLMIGMLFLTKPQPPTIPITARHDAQILRRGVLQQFAESQTVLAGLGVQPEQDSALINELIAQHRNFEKLAEAQGEIKLARVLRALEPLLLALDQPVDAGAGAELREQLQFEIAAMQTKWAPAASKHSIPTL